MEESYPSDRQSDPAMELKPVIKSSDLEHSFLPLPQQTEDNLGRNWMDNAFVKENAPSDSFLKESQGNENNSIENKANCCVGFEESLVLAVKDCFFEEDIKLILIKKTRNGKKVKYHSRNCTNVVTNKKVCDTCDLWFMQISDQPFLSEPSASVKRQIDNFLDVKLDVTKTFNDDFSAFPSSNGYVKLEDSFDDCLDDTVKKEVIDNNVEGELEESYLPDFPDPPDEDYEIKPVKKKKLKIKPINDPSENHTIIKRKIPPESHVEGGFLCRYRGCGKIFKKRKGWLKHDRTHDKIKKTCEICGIAVSKLREHIKRTHEEGDGGRNWERQRKYSEDRADDGTYICRVEDCRRVFATKKCYLKHAYLIHEGGNEKRRQKKICDICGASISANGMNQHVRSVHTHKDERNFHCEHCGKKFKHRTELTSHITHHTGELNFSCTGCGKKHRRSGEARLCEKTHRGIFKHSCHLCDYKTHKKNSLERHLNSHVKSTPFSCPVCGFKSGRKDNLKQHVEKRHCSNGTSIQQLERIYPNMYEMEPVEVMGEDNSATWRHTVSPEPDILETKLIT